MVFQADSTQLNILITGGGLIGGTLAFDYSQALQGAEITVYEIDAQSARNLLLELKKKGVENVTVITDESELLKVSARADVVDHCVPIDALKDVQQKIGSSLKNGAVVTNRGSAQAYSSQSISRHIDNDRGIYHFGIHPVVGRERKPGQPLEIHEGTFKNETAIMEPLPENASAGETIAHKRLQFINEAIGFNVKILPPHIHDRLLGALSHENTLALQTLVNSRDGGVSSGLGATMMRAASGTTGMWSPIHEFNSAAVAASHDVQSKNLQRLRELLENDDAEGLHNLVSEANIFRSEWGDVDTNIESLDGAIAELGVDGVSVPKDLLASQISVPFAVSIARTLGIKETVEGLEKDLGRYGHSYVDLLNSSARDSTLAARYNPEDVTQLFLVNKDGVLKGISEFAEMQGKLIASVNLHAEKDKENGLILNAHIEEATLTMAAKETPAPRRTGGGDGFEAFNNPVSAHRPVDNDGLEITVKRSSKDLSLN